MIPLDRRTVILTVTYRQTIPLPDTVSSSDDVTKTDLMLLIDEMKGVKGSFRRTLMESALIRKISLFFANELTAPKKISLRRH